MCCGDSVLERWSPARREVQCVLGECSTGNAKGTSGTLTHSGSLCVTAEAISTPPAHLVLDSFVAGFHCSNWREERWWECAPCQILLGVLNKSCVAKRCGLTPRDVSVYVAAYVGL